MRRRRQFWNCAVDNNRIGQLLSTAQFYGKILKKNIFAAVWVVENVCWITTGENFRFACICGGAIAREAAMGKYVRSSKVGIVLRITTTQDGETDLGRSGGTGNCACDNN